MKSKSLLALVLVFVFAATAHAQLFGGRRHRSPAQDYITKGEVWRMMLQQQVRDNTEQIRTNTAVIEQIRNEIIKTQIKAYVQEQIQAKIQTVQPLPPTTTVVQPVYRRIETLPPARVYPVRPVPYQGGKR